MKMLIKFSEGLSQFLSNSQLYLKNWLIVIAGLWAFNILHWILGSPLNGLGIVPRRLRGLGGILFSPLLHQNFNHLFFNSIPLFVLGLIVLSRGAVLFIEMSAFIILVGGFCVWLLGRRASHIGASGLISGYFGFVVVWAYVDPNAVTILLALIVLYYFGSILLGLFPREAKVSWESHLYGFLSGLLVAYLIAQNKKGFSLWIRLFGFLTE